MRVGVYFSPWDRVGLPTGVGRHALEMVRALGERDDIELSLVASQSDAGAAEEILARQGAPAGIRVLPASARVSRILFNALNLVNIDRWIDGVDWLYCPKEQPVRTRSVKLAVNVHDVLAFEPPIDGLFNRPDWRSRLRWSTVIDKLRRADLVTTVSEYTKRRLVETCRLKSDQIVVAGNGVSEVFYRTIQPSDRDVLEKYQVRSGEYFFSCGSLTRRKGGDLLMAAVAKLADEWGRMPVLLSGRRHDQDLLAQYEAQFSKSHPASLRLLGYISDEEQAVLMSHALGFLFPSRYEGFGIPILEAMAAGTVVICSRLPALVEVGGNAGIFLEANTPDHMADAMKLLINGQVDRVAVVENGRVRADKFRWEACADRLIEAMRSCGTRCAQTVLR